MIVNVDKEYELFLSNCLTELSKHKSKNVTKYLFMALADDDIIIACNDCNYIAKGMFASHLQMQAQYEFTIDSMLNDGIIADCDDEEDESEDDE